MSKETFFAAASASHANQGQPYMTSMSPASFPEPRKYGHMPYYTIPHSGVGQAMDNHQPMPSEFRVVENYDHTGAPTVPFLTRRRVIARGSHPMHKVPAPVTPPSLAAPLVAPPIASPAAVIKSVTHEAPSISTINKIDIMVDRFRCQGLTKEQVLEQHDLYPEAKELTDMDIQAHAQKLYGRGRNTYCVFRQWSPDAKFVDEAVANNYLVVTDIPKADPHGNKPRDISRRADRLNAIFVAIFSEADLLGWMTERTRLPTMMDAATGVAAARFSNGGSSDNDDDDEDEMEKKDISEFIEHPDGSVAFNPDYLERMNGEGSGPLRAAVKKSILSLPADDEDNEPGNMPACLASTPTEVSEEESDFDLVEHEDGEIIEFTENNYEDDYLII
ncbi:hypothetical protein PG991_008356 [Apiospora marii]|uniref:Uncharacterized protein n=1 Tax=Apiospora marii TaxID=335849 RepID=A0ABR1RQP6_9PEZI